MQTPAHEAKLCSQELLPVSSGACLPARVLVLCDGKRRGSSQGMSLCSPCLSHQSRRADGFDESCSNIPCICKILGRKDTIRSHTDSLGLSTVVPQRE